MSEAINAALEELRAERVALDNIITALEQRVSAAPVVESRLLPAPREPSKAKTSEKPRPAKKDGDLRLCSAPGCSKPLRSNNTVGLCRIHNPRVVGGRVASGSPSNGDKPSEAKIRAERKRVLAEVLKHAPGTTERADALRAVAETPFEYFGETKTMSVAGLRLWLNALEG